MDLDVLLGQLQLARQKLRNLHSLITLQLDNLTQLVVLDDIAITSKILLQNFQDLLQVILVGHTLNSGKGFTPVTLLDTDMDVVCWLRFGITSVGEGIFLLVRNKRWIKLIKRTKRVQVLDS